MQRMTRRVAGIGLGLTLAALAFPGGAAAETVKLRFTSYAPATNFLNTEVITGFMDKVVADSEGTLTYQLFPGGTLGRNPAEQIKLVQEGVADAGLVVPAFTPGTYDLYGVVELPGLVEHPVEGATLLALAHEAGVLETPDRTHMLGLFTSEMNGIHLREPIADLDGLKGKRLRTNGAPVVAGVERLGGVPVTGLASTEVAEGVSRGTIDGAVIGPAALDAFRVSEVTRQHMRAPMGASAMMLVMNLNTWNKLPEPAKRAFEKHGGTSFAEFAGTIFARQADEAFARVTAMDGHSEFVFDEATAAGFNARIGDFGPEWAAANPQRAAVYDFAVETLGRIRGQ